MKLHKNHEQLHDESSKDKWIIPIDRIDFLKIDLPAIYQVVNHPKFIAKNVWNSSLFNKK